VNQDDPVVVIETEKVTVELPAPASGTITTMLKQKGEKAAVGDVIGYMESNGAGSTIKAEAKRSAEPAAQETSEPAPPQPKPASVVAPPSSPVASPPRPASGVREEQVIPMTPIRRRIAERLVEAQKSAALLTTFNEADMSAVMTLRRKHKEGFQERYGIKLGLMSFFVKASIDALKAIPQLNAEVRGHDIVFRNYYDIGIAVGGGKGLVVPILRGAERMSFAEIETAIADFGARAQSNQLKVDELQGGTFTISNGGVYGSLLSTPIVNPPQSGVLGLHAIADRPVAVDGAVVIRPMMYLALGYDHRIVDGREAVTFLKRIKDLIEDPARMFLEI
jgi:2-oxoglutarate dehydrogenase E2 component (dihydrolipoamide succinyltransferase)